ncbi:uncharacterized protein ACA1_142280 [Acanthamoeba castellanii str. Neff]|uniref:F-box domain-containing protein n=1 Tax=Acanthamoeba castellanii (strain ATCC 30010 / Neff) TaxID=1257118 RepID=L8HBC0_ACACF|nr:uncharacterized protein ACA1_142280 [Acanthamoeba castellanii str. Neff]ELR22537.1 hypothetical protein ACA1_142280 [Acanthamoeba castellanii str. Neff]
MAKLLEGGISPIALLAQEEQRQAEQKAGTSWSPLLKEAVDAKARSALELHNQGEGRDTSGPLAQLPPELLQALLAFLDYKSLLVLGQTCAWLYGVVMDRTLVMAKLLDRLGAVRAACWAMVSRSMAQHAARPPLAGIAAFEKVFHPDAPRMAVCASIRLFPLPKALSSFRDELPVVMASALSDKAVAIPPEVPAAGADINPFGRECEPDAWEDWSEPATRRISFSRLVPVASVADFDKIIRANETIKLYSKTKVEVCVPSAQHALGALAALVDCDQISLWHEPFFEKSGYAGCRFLVAGGGSGAVVQWEYYSNFCGGLYAGFSCGMG